MQNESRVCTGSMHADCAGKDEGSRRKPCHTLLDASSSFSPQGDGAQHPSDALSADIALAHKGHAQHVGVGGYAQASAEGTHSTATTSKWLKTGQKQGLQKAVVNMAARIGGVWHLVAGSEVSIPSPPSSSDDSETRQPLGHL
jgi:hypothetical protein